MPEWLSKNENYMPLNDNDAFIDKSMISLINILSKFGIHEKQENNLKVNALVKLLTVIIIIIFNSLAHNIGFVFVTLVCLLVILNFLNTEEIKSIMKVSFVTAIFTFIILLPSLYLGYGNNAFMIALKVLNSVAFVNILAVTTNWNDLISALKMIHVPDIFILVLDITIKYIIILGEFSLNMIYALKLRSVGKSKNKAASLSGIVGTMILKSKEMAEEMYGAMECRGFAGEYKVYVNFIFNLSDYIVVLFDILFIFAYFYLAY